MTRRTRRVVGVFDERRKATSLLRGLRDRRVSKDLDRNATEQHPLAYAEPSRASPEDIDVGGYWIFRGTTSAGKKAEHRGENASGSQKANRRVADVDLKQGGEEVGLALKGLEGLRQDDRETIHQEHGSAHEVGQAVQPGVRALV